MAQDAAAGAHAASGEDDEGTAGVGEALGVPRAGDGVQIAKIQGSVARPAPWAELRAECSATGVASGGIDARHRDAMTGLEREVESVAKVRRDVG